MSKKSAPAMSPEERTGLLRLAAASTVWLIGAPVAAHFLWVGVPWIVVLLLAAMAELIVLTLLLLASTLHDPIKRWELPPNPADAERGWRAKLARGRDAMQAAAAWVRSKLLRRPAAPL